MLIRVLLAVSSPSLRRRLQALIADLDVSLFVVEDPESFWDRLGREACDLVIADPAAVPPPWSETLQALRQLPEHTELIVVTPSESAEERARFQAAGAFAVVQQQLPDDAVRRSLTTLIGRRREAAASVVKAEQQEGAYQLSDFSAASPAMREVLKVANRVALSDSSLLIVGETGSGKEWLARGIHGASRRRQAPFVAVNCAAVPETLLESELFGHERGAFTGAVRSRRGFFELAHRGTVFLDEIGEMELHIQAKLLRVLQDRKVQRLGSEEAVEVDVRVMAATNREPQAAIDARELRSDLYYRLAVVTLALPPLRRRREDIRPLVESYLHHFRVQLGRWEVTRVAETAMTALEQYDWPGNVRELINVMERAVLLCEGEEIAAADLPPPIGRRLQPAGVDLASMITPEVLSRSLDDARTKLIESFEREYLAALLEETGGSVGRTAERAGIDPRTLYNKMRRYGLDKTAFRSQSRA